MNSPVQCEVVSSRPHRRELALVTFVFLVGLLLRAWSPSELGLEAFDEGVYAFSALGLSDHTQPHRLYPTAVRFSPPVFYSLAGFLSWGSGLTPDRAAIAVSAILGASTVPLVWAVGRSWFGPGAGLAAATLLALNQFHIALSRSALTDATFSFFLVAALGMLRAALERPKAATAVGAGLLTGVAWNTKYHGWFALVIAALPLLRANIRVIVALAFSSFVAAACYLPWALFIEAQPGGYAALAVYQRGMLDPNWPGNLWRQIQQQLFFDGAFTAASVPLALALVCAARSAREEAMEISHLVVVGVAVSLLSLFGGGFVATCLLGSLAVPALLRSGSTAAWMLLGWLALFFLSTPLYQPYARLLLPFVIAAQLAAGRAVESVLRGNRTGSGNVAVAFLGACAAVVACARLATNDASNPWRPSRTVAHAAEEIGRFVPPGSRVIVIGEPDLAFYLHVTGRPAFERTETFADWDSLGLDSPTYFVTGVYARKSPILRDGIQRLGPRLRRITTVHMDPKDLRIIDDFPPDRAAAYRARTDGTYDLTLYLLAPRGG